MFPLALLLDLVPINATALNASVCLLGFLNSLSGFAPLAGEC